MALTTLLSAAPAFIALALRTAVLASFAIATAWAEIDTTRHLLTDYVTVKSLGGKD